MFRMKGIRGIFSGTCLRVLGCFVALSCVAMNAVAQGFVPSAPLGPKGLIGSTAYNYGASVIQVGSTRHYFWCGPYSQFASGVNYPPYDRDNILYAAFDVNQNAWVTGVEVVLTPSIENPQLWDSAHTCDPSVVVGPWNYGGVTHDWVLYYTGASMAHSGAGSQQSEVNNNKIGVAFLKRDPAGNALTKWKVVRASGNPVIKGYAGSDAEYSAGQQSVWRTATQIHMAYTDTTWPGSAPSSKGAVVIASSSDGVNFTPVASRKVVSRKLINKACAIGSSGCANTAGIDRSVPAQWNNDFAPLGGYIYSVQPRMMLGKLTVNSGGAQESHLLNVGSQIAICGGAGTIPSYGVAVNCSPETYEMGIYRMPLASFFAGTGDWQLLGWIDTASTGSQNNFAPSLVRDGYGNLLVTSNSLTVVFSAGRARIAEGPNQWKTDLVELMWKPASGTLSGSSIGAPRVALTRYASYASGGMHWSTTGFVSPSFRDPSQGGSGRKDGVLGFIDSTPSLAANEKASPLYLCQVGFFSGSNFGQATYWAAAKLSQALPESSRFADTDSNCGGVGFKVGTLGYVYLDPASSVGRAAQRAIWLCRNRPTGGEGYVAGGNYYVSTDSNCEVSGAKSIKRLGYIYPSP